MRSCTRTSWHLIFGRLKNTPGLKNQIKYIIGKKEASTTILATNQAWNKVIKIQKKKTCRGTIRFRGENSHTAPM